MANVRFLPAHQHCSRECNSDNELHKKNQIKTILSKGLGMTLIRGHMANRLDLGHITKE